jgi:hypothetical protein
MHIYAKRLSVATIKEPLFFSFNEFYQQSIDKLKAERIQKEQELRIERRKKFTVVKCNASVGIGLLGRLI